MDFGKDEIIKIVKDQGIDIAEDAAEMAAKSLANMSIEMLEKFVDDGKTDWKDMLLAATKGQLQELADAITVKF